MQLQIPIDSFGILLVEIVVNSNFIASIDT